MKRFALLLISSCLFATPAQVILIRHGEKPPKGHCLSLKGRERAAALVPFFLGEPEVLKFGPPAAIYAMSPSDEDPSLRPQQTVIELAETMHLPLENQYIHDEYPKMVKEILDNPDYDGKMVLICWAHDAIPQMARLFGSKAAPDKWEGKTFDRAWILTFKENGHLHFKNWPQKLLYGDSTH